MKKIFLLFLLLANQGFAKGAPETQADYIVPVAANLVPYSRFKVDIVKPYIGDATKEISYIFPKELTGDPALQVNMKLVSMDTNLNLSEWDSPEMSATCTADDERVTCNMYVKKSAGRFLDTSKAIDFLTKTSTNPSTLQSQIEVLESFIKKEPGGILTYEFENN